MFEKVESSKKFFGYIIAFVVILFFSFYYFGKCFDNFNYKKYTVVFDNSVNGLKLGANVSYKGVNIGIVESIEIKMPEDKIFVSIKVNKKMPIYKNCTAKLIMIGITGYSMISLQNGEDKILNNGENIQGIPSIIDDLYLIIPECIINISNLAKKLSIVVDANATDIKNSISQLVEFLVSLNIFFSTLNVGVMNFSKVTVGIHEQVLPELLKILQEIKSVILKIDGDELVFKEKIIPEIKELLKKMNNITNSAQKASKERKGLYRFLPIH